MRALLAGAGPVVAAFATFGAFWGSWAVMLFNIQHAFGLDDAQLGVLLAVAIAVAGASSAVMAHLCARVGARRLLWIALLAWAVMLCVLAAMTNKWAFAVALVLTEVAGGSIDTAMNAEASHRLVGHPAMLVRLHALFNGGALVGAAVAAHRDPRRRVLALDLARYRRRGPGGRAVGRRHRSRRVRGGGHGRRSEPARRRTHLRRLRREGLLVLLVVFALAEITEGGVDTWGVLYLRNHLATGVLLGAGAYVVGQAVAATTRGAAGPLLGRLSSRHALIVGGCVAGAGILLESLTSLSGPGRLRAGARGRRRVLVLAARDEHGQPHGEPGRRHRRDVHRGRVRRAGSRGRPSSVGSPRRWAPAHGLQVLALASFGVAGCTLFSGEPVPS